DPARCVLDLVTQNDSSCAVRADHTLWCWGNNAHGQIGNNTIVASTTPIQASLANAARVTHGAFHTYAVDTNGMLWAWGSNPRNELGDGLIADSLVPKMILT